MQFKMLKVYLCRTGKLLPQYRPVQNILFVTSIFSLAFKATLQYNRIEVLRVLAAFADSKFGKICNVLYDECLLLQCPSGRNA